MLCKNTILIQVLTNRKSYKELFQHLKEENDSSTQRNQKKDD